jgi:YggT family protein
MGFVVVFFRFLIVALYVLLLARVLMSWVNPRFDGTIGRFVYETTEPFLAPIRRFLPQTGPLDLSPLIAFLILSVVAAMFGLR